MRRRVRLFTVPPALSQLPRVGLRPVMLLWIGDLDRKPFLITLALAGVGTELFYWRLRTICSVSLLVIGCLCRLLFVLCCRVCAMIIQRIGTTEGFCTLAGAIGVEKHSWNLI